MFERFSLLTWIAVGCAVIAAAILVGFLIVRPRRGPAPKLSLFLGLCVFPTATALVGNVQGYQATQERRFCGSCHVMIPYEADARDPHSNTLSARHARNAQFGAESCYACHATYGMYGTVLTKIGGMRHVWFYYTEYKNYSLEESKEKIHLRKPFPNETCIHCHSTENEGWLRTPDHQSTLADVRAGKVSCASGGCHGFAHPYTKTREQLEGAKPLHARAEKEGPP
jgi:cytochrome c-type protein NapC